MNAFVITSLIYLTILIIRYFSSSRITTRENSIFKKIMIANEIGLIIELSCFFTVTRINEMPILNYLTTHLLLVYYVIYVLLFTYYLFFIAKQGTPTKKYLRIVNMFCTIYFVANVMAIIILPMYYHTDNNIYYSYGPSVNFLFISYALLNFIWVLCIIKNFKNLKTKKMLPVIILIFLGTIAGIVQKINPSLLLMTAIDSIVTFIMFFTIENPDIKMLNEMYKNKELMEQGYEDKYNFLFEMTQEARGPLVNINGVSNALRMEDDPRKIKDGLLSLNNMVRQLDFSINNILNISSLDVQKIKIVDNKYDLEKLCYDLEVRVRSELKESVKFNLSIPKQLPILYGDYMKIRQILYSLLINACKNTETGSINMKVNLIEKYDVARLIFNISDTGMGMPIEKINDILSSTGSLDQNEIDNLEKKEFNVKVCQKVVKIMGGNLMIKSNIGEGTEVILTIDQRVYHEKDNSILNQYENVVSNYRKVLIVSQNKDKIAVIKKKLSDNHITYSNLYYGADAIDRIKSGKKFDFILVEDEMAEMTGLMTLKGMQEIKGFNTPVIIMLNEDKGHIKDHYLNDGFSDYLLLDNLEVELDRIIEKY